jgi:hypothetical protein
MLLGYNYNKNHSWEGSSTEVISHDICVLIGKLKLSFGVNTNITVIRVICV